MFLRPPFLHGRIKVTLSPSFFPRKPNDNGCLDTCQPPYFFFDSVIAGEYAFPAVPLYNYKICRFQKSNFKIITWRLKLDTLN